jgi:hypothetical protein
MTTALLCVGFSLDDNKYLERIVKYMRTIKTPVIWLEQYPEELIYSTDIMVDKIDLVNILTKWNINVIYFAGDINNEIVNTILLNYTIIPIKELVTNIKKQVYMHIRDIDHVYGSGDSFLIHNFIPDDLIPDLFNTIKNEIKWNTMTHKGGEVPRLVAVQGEINNGAKPIYRHPAENTPELTEFSKSSKLIRDYIMKELLVFINHVLIQYYRNGHDHIGEHSDKTIDVNPNSYIMNYSIGAERTFVLKHKLGAEETQKIKLPHNSLFVMGLQTNKEWYHSIKQDKRPDCEKTKEELAYGGERISFTWRNIATYIKNNRLFGQGAKYLKYSDTLDITNLELDTELIKAFGEENHNPNFDWNNIYGKLIGRKI